MKAGETYTLLDFNMEEQGSGEGGAGVHEHVRGWVLVLKTRMRRKEEKANTHLAFRCHQVIPPLQANFNKVRQRIGGLWLESRVLTEFLISPSFP